MKKQFAIVAAAVLVISIFLPWITIMGFSGSIWDLLTRGFKDTWYLGAPIVGGVIAIAGLLFVANKKLPALIGAAAGFVPVAALGYQAYQTASYLGAMSSSSSGSSGFNYGELFQFLGIGIYFCIAASIVLLIAGLRGVTDETPGSGRTE